MSQEYIQQLRTQLDAEKEHHRQEEIAATELARQLAAEGEKVQSLVEMLEQVLQETVDARDYPDGPCLNADTRTEIKILLAKVKEGK